MPRPLAYSTTTANEQTKLMGGLLAGGRLIIFTAPMPPTPESPPGEARKLIEFLFESPAFDDPVNGVGTAKRMPGAYALVTGRAVWYRTVRADGYVVFDGTVGLPGDEDDPNLVIDKVDLEQGALVTIQEFTYVSPTS